MSDELIGLDAWIEGESPDPGSTTGPDQPLYLHCTVCEWRGTFSELGTHWRATGHPAITEASWKLKEQLREQFDHAGTEIRRG